MDIENWTLEILDALARKIPFVRPVYYVVTSLATFLSALGTVYEWFGISKPAYGLLTVTLVTLSSSTIFILSIVGLLRKKYRRLIETFDEVTALQKNSHCIETIKRSYLIDKNGDTVCTREAEIQSLGDTVRFEQIMFGATPEGATVSNFQKLHFSVVATHTRTPMKNIVLSDDERRKRVVVIFNPPLKPGKSVAYTMTYRWPGLWKPLLANGHDYGFVNVKVRTKHMVLELTVPGGYYVEHFNVVPEVGTVEISSGKSAIVWTVDDPEEGQYRYEIFCAQIPNAGVASD